MISAGMLAKVRRLHLRAKLSIREVSRRTGLSRKTLRQWLRRDGVTEPKYPKRQENGVLDPWVEQLEAVLVAAERALEAGRPSAKHVLNVLARLKDGAVALRAMAPVEQIGLVVKELPHADVRRHDRLRMVNAEQPEERTWAPRSSRA